VIATLRPITPGKVVLRGDALNGGVAYFSAAFRSLHRLVAVAGGCRRKRLRARPARGAARGNRDVAADRRSAVLRFVGADLCPIRRTATAAVRLLAADFDALSELAEQALDRIGASPFAHDHSRLGDRRPARAAA